MTETRTITAADAANSPELWRKVQRGEVIVRNAAGEPCTVFKAASGLYVSCGEMGWRSSADEYSGYDHCCDEMFTITDIPPAEQSENSPANVERFKSKIRELELEVEVLRREKVHASEEGQS